jgi:hypothetical protein
VSSVNVSRTSPLGSPAELNERSANVSVPAVSSRMTVEQRVP